MKTVFVFMLFLSVVVSGCAVGDVVYMKNKTTGKTVKCGGHLTFGNIPAGNELNLQKQRYCMDDFRRQGYVRTEK